MIDRTENDPNIGADKRTVRGRIRQVLSALMKGGLSPARAATAVFVGCFIGVVPIYGFQSMAAIGLAVVLKLNKPLTFAATFVNNPLLQPILVIASLEVGHRILYGQGLPPRVSEIREMELQQHLGAWLVGSIALGLILAGAAACSTYVFLVRRQGRTPARTREKEGTRFVNSLYANGRRADRNFVKWKLRLDKVFPLLLREDLGVGPVVDLGCGYGIVLALVGYGTADRRLFGCDIDEHRIAAARGALAPLKAELSIADARTFELREAGLILIIDVLQYLESEEQLTLLKKCCSSLLPAGKLIFRVPDISAPGLRAKLTIAFDRLVFLLHRTEARPTVLSRVEYRRALQSEGMTVREQPFVNRIPLAHVLFIAEKSRSPQE